MLTNKVSGNVLLKRYFGGLTFCLGDSSVRPSFKTGQPVVEVGTFTADGVKAYFIDIVDSFAKNDTALYMRCTSFKLIWCCIVCGVIKGYGLNHIATTLPWREYFQQFFFAVNNAYSIWSIDFMTRKNEEITAQLLNIYRRVSY